MSYTVWIMVEDDDGQGGEGRTYWSVDHYERKRDAIKHAKVMAEQERLRTGVEPQRLDDR